MASSSSSPSSSSSSGNLKISIEDIKLYYTIDRKIFARLVLNIGRDPGESLHVMALLLWLERYSGRTGNLVCNIQLWPDGLINALADEAVQCLYCLKSHEFPFSHIEGSNFIIPLIRKLTKKELSLRCFHNHRLDIIPGIVQLVHDVCLRAFDDIVQQALALTNPLAAGQGRIEQNLRHLRFSGPPITPIFPVYNCHSSRVGDIGDQNMADQQTLRPNSNTGDWGYSSGVDPHGLSLRVLSKSKNKNDMEELLNSIHDICITSLEDDDDDNNNNNNNNNKEEEVAAEDRTIFLTFSKGYPISGNEVTDFFNRKFGHNFVEGVTMQEAPAGEQPLYARLVVSSAAGLEIVLNGKPKAKFSINGKHVWSRKFVPRYPKSPHPMLESNHLP